VIKTENINEPPNFSIEMAEDAEMSKDILIIISREKSSIVTLSSIAWAAMWILAKASTVHTSAQPSFIPGTSKPKRGSTSQYIRSVVLKVPSHDKSSEIP